MKNKYGLNCNKNEMASTLISFQYLLLLFCIALVTSCRSKTIQNTDSYHIQIDTSRYWKYNGKRTLLLGAFNHGHNPFVDGSTLDEVLVDDIEVIITQIQEMVDAGGNTLRCVLDPGMAASRGIESYHKNEEGQYDLSNPVGSYWERLSTFIAEAEKRNVIVELEIWDRFDWYGTNWDSSPFNPNNNINYTRETSGLEDNYERHMVYVKHPMSKGVPGHLIYDTASLARKAQYDMVRTYQEIFVQKVLSCAFFHKNVLYNMNNETAEPAAWGRYWINLVKGEAAKAKLSIVCTDMVDGAHNIPDSKELNYQLAHPEIYDYLDVSQVNSRHRDEVHWNKIKWVADQAKSKGYLLHMTKLYGSDSDGYIKPWDGWKPGDDDNAIEEWWRNLIAGVAGVRFHRQPTGLGLNNKSKACIRATRKVESKVKFWDVNPRLDLLTEREEDEAYLAADPGIQYILYFTHQGEGSVGLNLKKYEGIRYNIAWVNIDTGEWGPKSKISGGNNVTINRPDNSSHWVACVWRIE